MTDSASTVSIVKVPPATPKNTAPIGFMPTGAFCKGLTQEGEGVGVISSLLRTVQSHFMFRQVLIPRSGIVT